MGAYLLSIRRVVFGVCQWQTDAVWHVLNRLQSNAIRQRCQVCVSPAKKIISGFLLPGQDKSLTPPYSCSFRYHFVSFRFDFSYDNVI
ncbi:MAG: hypothetical protein AMXMBFR84_31080 [Candidatus Hydrogenedentota bacterium]